MPGAERRRPWEGARHSDTGAHNPVGPEKGPARKPGAVTFPPNPQGRRHAHHAIKSWQKRNQPSGPKEDSNMPIISTLAARSGTLTPKISPRDVARSCMAQALNQTPRPAISETGEDLQDPGRSRHHDPHRPGTERQRQGKAEGLAHIISAAWRSWRTRHTEFSWRRSKTSRTATP